MLVMLVMLGDDDVRDAGRRRDRFGRLRVQVPARRSTIGATASSADEPNVT